MTGGSGNDRFYIGRVFRPDDPSITTTGGNLLTDADIITDLSFGDSLQLIGGLTANDLVVTAGTGAYEGSAVLQDFGTGQFLAVLQGIDPASLVFGATSVSIGTLGTTPPASGSFTFTLADATVAEDAGTATVTITRTGDLATATSVSFTTADGTATAGSDYTSTTQTVSFAAGQGTATVSVPILSDTATEGNETVNLTLTGSSGTTLDSGTLTITDTTTTTPPAGSTFTIASVSVTEDVGNATITVTRSDGTAAETVSFATSDGTATAGSDMKWNKL